MRFSFDNLMTYVDYELNNYRIFFILRNLSTKVFMDVVSCVYNFSNGSEGKNQVYIYDCVCVHREREKLAKVSISIYCVCFSVWLGRYHFLLRLATLESQAVYTVTRLWGK